MSVIQLTQMGPVAIVALNRPEVHNALNAELLAETTAVFQTLQQDPQTRVVILTGNGPTFCAGGDLKMMREAADYTFAQNKAGGYEIFDLLAVLNEFPKPIIGRVQGSALGGGVGLVSCCDIVVAHESAQNGFSRLARSNGFSR
jgi:methylglutaconyl-CoA hydratase